jgi:hypothetical protein
VKFSEIVDQASAFLQRRGRVSYRALRREFDLHSTLLETYHLDCIPQRGRSFVLVFVALCNRTTRFSFANDWSNWWTMHEPVVL